MSRFLIACMLILLDSCATKVVVIEPKPDLGESVTLAYIDCPDNAKDGCFLIQIGTDAYYVVKGTYQKEEYIWKLNVDATEKDVKNYGRVYGKYLVLVWTKYST